MLKSQFITNKGSWHWNSPQKLTIAEEGPWPANLNASQWHNIAPCPRSSWQRTTDKRTENRSPGTAAGSGDSLRRLQNLNSYGFLYAHHNLWQTSEDRTIRFRSKHHWFRPSIHWIHTRIIITHSGPLDCGVFKRGEHNNCAASDRREFKLVRVSMTDWDMINLQQKLVLVPDKQWEGTLT